MDFTIEIHQFLWTNLWPQKMEKNNNSMNHGNLPAMPHVSQEGLWSPPSSPKKKAVSYNYHEWTKRRQKTPNQPSALQTCKSSSPFTAATSVIPRIGWNPVIKTTRRIMVSTAPFFEVPNRWFFEADVSESNWFVTKYHPIAGMWFSHGFF